jgi:hypothetical protein
VLLSGGGRRIIDTVVSDRVFRAQSVSADYLFVDVNGITHSDIPQTTLFRDSIDLVDISVGAKFRPWRNLSLAGDANNFLASGSK